MGETTGISWTDSTFNPWVGCTKISPGCANCYAEVLNKRFGKDVWGAGKPRQRTAPANWRKPLAWNKAVAASGERHLVFCASMADWLDPEVPIEWLADLLELIASTPRLTWQLLTKRPELWRGRMEAAADWMAAHNDNFGFHGVWRLSDWLAGIAPANVWLGTTVEDQRRADERIPALLTIPARVRFLSMEPLLEPVDLHTARYAVDAGLQGAIGAWGGIDWVIVGGESGAKARPFNLNWARSIVRDCKASGVPVFVKQMGDAPVCDPYSANAREELRALGRRNFTEPMTFTAHHGANPSEWPADLRVQEFPT